MCETWQSPERDDDGTAAMSDPRSFHHLRSCHATIRVEKSKSIQVPWRGVEAEKGRPDAGQATVGAGLRLRKSSQFAEAEIAIRRFSVDVTTVFLPFFPPSQCHKRAPSAPNSIICL